MQIYGIKRIFFFVFFGGLKKKQYLCSVNAKIGICFYFYFFLIRFLHTFFYAIRYAETRAYDARTVN